MSNPDCSSLAVAQEQEYWRTWRKTGLPDKLVFESSDDRSPHLSRGFKIEDVANTDIPQIFSYAALSHAISGSVGGNVAMTAFYPLDQLVLRAQVDGRGKHQSTWSACKEVIQKEGISGLYRGIGSTLGTLFAANFIYFYCFHLLRVICTETPGMRGLCERLGISRPMLNLLIGTVAGAINVGFVQPLWVANARMKLQGVVTDQKDRYTSTLDVLIRIYREEGLGKLWAGVSSSLMLCCNPAIQFAVYETVKKAVVKHKASIGKPSRLSSLEAFFLGAVSKWIATVATYPLQVAQARLRLQKTGAAATAAAAAGGGGGVYRGTLDCLIRTYRAEGWPGLFRGIQTKLWHSTLISALMFLTYEKIQRAVERALAAAHVPAAPEPPRLAAPAPAPAAPAQGDAPAGGSAPADGRARG